MSKILVMENYVDECLDEVEIRDLFIQEMSPRKTIINNLINDLHYWREKLSDMSADSYTNIKYYTSDKIKFKEIINKINISIKAAKAENASVLSNIPYIYQHIGIGVIVAAVAYGSYRLYKRFMTTSAKACQGKKGKMKTICMNQYQIKGLEASKKPLEHGIKGCSNAKDIQKCKSMFNKKINAINSRIIKKQNKIKKLMGR